MNPLFQLKPSHGADLILAERKRQIEQLGFSAEQDDEYIGRELARAADCYACPPKMRNMDPSCNGRVPVRWPWTVDWWKPNENRERELVKAGALYLAQADKNMRAKQPAAERLSRIMAQRMANKIDRLSVGRAEVEAAYHA